MESHARAGDGGGRGRCAETRPLQRRGGRASNIAIPVDREGRERVVRAVGKSFGCRRGVQAVVDVGAVAGRRRRRASSRASDNRLGPVGIRRIGPRESRRTGRGRRVQVADSGGRSVVAGVGAPGDGACQRWIAASQCCSKSNTMRSSLSSMYAASWTVKLPVSSLQPRPSPHTSSVGPVVVPTPARVALVKLLPASSRCPLPGVNRALQVSTSPADPSVTAWNRTSDSEPEALIVALSGSNDLGVPPPTKSPESLSMSHAVRPAVPSPLSRTR